MRSIGGFRHFEVELLKRPRHLRSRSDRSQRKLKSALTHSASEKDKINHEHNREQVGKPADLASATAESFHDRTADESKRQAVSN